MEKMYLIPEHELHNLKKTTSEPISKLDQEMTAILNSSLPIYEKIQLYNQTLMKYLDMDKKEQDKSIQIQVSTPTQSFTQDRKPIKDILAFIPKNSQKYAENILHEIMNNSSILDFNQQGEIFVNHSKIPQSNITDLLKKVLIRTKTKNQPIGLELFKDSLIKLHIPPSILNMEDNSNESITSTINMNLSPKKEKEEKKKKKKTQSGGRIKQFQTRMKLKKSQVVSRRKYLYLN